MQNMEGKTLLASFLDIEKNEPNKPFLRQPFGERWEVYSYSQVGEMARRLAAALRDMNLRDNAHIGLVSKNCREWIIADLAIMMAGYVSVPFFATLTGEQIAQVLELGDVDALFVGKLEVWHNDMKTGVPADMPIITFPLHPGGNDKIERGQQWSDVLAKYEPLQDLAEPKLDELWTIIFTSGTTGTPKGVMHNYSSATNLLTATRKENQLRMDFSGKNDFFSYLPMNHIMERIVIEGACLSYGGQISFAENLGTFAKNLSDTQPTIFIAVPRIYTKFQMGILGKMPQKRLDLLLKIPIVSGIIKKKLAQGLGMTRAKRMISGAAAIPQSTKDWFRKIGMPISEGYGMTENSAACTFLPEEDERKSSVGKAQPGTEIKIAEGSGEILSRSSYNMVGYYKSPEKTAETLTDNWLHTGDQGRLDDDGFLYITGRVKDQFKTAKGEFIVPAPIEKEFSANTDIEQMCILGLGLPQPVMLVVPSEIGMAKEKSALQAGLDQQLVAVNKTIPNYTKISTIIVVKEPFSVENGCLTPTLKVKRNALNQRYQDKLWGWHEEKDKIVFE
ncbi:MAG: AMP-binding protein [Saprospiraceae bacterium]